MKFNLFVWELYKKSEHGKKTMRQFSHLTNKFIEDWERNYSLSILHKRRRSNDLDELFTSLQAIQDVRQ
jgi:hypothetical protein